MSNRPDPFASIDVHALATVSGGAARVAAASRSGGSETIQLVMPIITQMMSMMTSMVSNTKSSSDQWMPLLMMLMNQRPNVVPQPIFLGGRGRKGW